MDPDDRRKKYLKTTAVGGRLFPMTRATAWYLWNTIRSEVSATGKANIDDVVLHTARHTCLTRLIRSGMRLHHVSKWAGHADVVITEKRYVKVDAGDLLDAYDSVIQPGDSGLRVSTDFDKRAVVPCRGGVLVAV